MFSKMGKLIKENQPASYTGMLTHTFCWVSSRAGNYHYNNPHATPSETDDRIDIYCVHGTADRPQAFARIAERLLAKGLPASIHSITLVSFDGRYQGKGIEFFAQQLMDKIRTDGAKRVILIGHSRGGLVNAYAAEYLAAQAGISVVSLFSLGTPFQGSTLAIAPTSWFSESVKQMEPDSPFLAKLREKILASSSLYYFIVGKDDYIVGSGRSHIPEYVASKPDSLIELETIHGHLSMMSSQKLIGQIHAILCRSKDNVPGSGQLFHPLSPLDIIEDYKPSTADSSVPGDAPHPEDESETSISGLFGGW